MTNHHERELEWFPQQESLEYEGAPVVVRWGNLTQSGTTSVGTADVRQFLSGRIVFADGRMLSVELPGIWVRLDHAARQACIEGCRAY